MAVTKWKILYQPIWLDKGTLILNITRYRKSSIKPPGGLFILLSPRGGLKRKGGLLEKGAF